MNLRTFMYFVMTSVTDRTHFFLSFYSVFSSSSFVFVFFFFVVCLITQTHFCPVHTDTGFSPKPNMTQVTKIITSVSASVDIHTGQCVFNLKEDKEFILNQWPASQNIPAHSATSGQQCTVTVDHLDHITNEMPTVTHTHTWASMIK